MNTQNSKDLRGTPAALAASLFFFLAAGAASAQVPAALSYSLAPGSSLSIAGESTLHAWSAKAASVELAASFATDQPTLRDAAAAGALKALTLSVPVDGLKTTEGGSMDKNMHRDLKDSAAPAITFTLLDLKTQADKSGVLQATARGTLSIAGVSKEVAVTGALTAIPGGVSVSGSYPLLMSDFGVKPPTMMFGTIKVADKVVVHYDLKLKASGI